MVGNIEPKTLLSLAAMSQDFSSTHNSAAKPPKISVCLTVRHQRDYAKQAIASILKQTVSDFELLICDAASAETHPTDTAKQDTSEKSGEPSNNTTEIKSDLSEHIQSLNDPRVHHLCTTWASRAAQLRSGFAAAQGQYFVQLDEKHRLTPDYLARTLAVLEAQEALDFVSTGHWLIDGAGRRDLACTENNAVQWGRTRLNDGVIADLVTETFLHQSLQVEATLFRRSVLDEVDYLRLGLEHCEDSDLLVRLAMANKQAYFLSARLMEYRQPSPSQELSQGLQYLKDKVSYLDFFKFSKQSLEIVRQQRLAASCLSLGLRQLEAEELAPGRLNLWQGRRAGFAQAIAGLALSYFPTSLRQTTLAWLRRSRAAQTAWTQSIA